MLSLTVVVVKHLFMSQVPYGLPAKIFMFSILSVDIFHLRSEV